MSKPENTYASSGVDIEAGNELVNRIKALAKSTSRDGVDSELGGFGGLFNLAGTNYNNPVLVAATDGVGTKLKIAQAVGKHNTIGIDLVAMCVNDLLVQGAEPLFFLDYFASGKLEVDVAEEVISGIAEGCKQAGCALLGGETAEMPGMYQGGEYDLAGFAVGAVEKQKILPKTFSIHEGDVLIALPSSGLHSNGFSLVRKIVADKSLSYSDKSPFSDPSLGEALLEPTIIYLKHTKTLLKGDQLKGMAHITGGGITENLPRILPENCGAEIDLSAWEFPPVFEWLQKEGNISNEEMLKTFNCGVGMILLASKNHSETVSQLLKMEGIKNFTIGRVIEKPANPVEYV